MSSSDRPDLVFLGATVETMTDDAGRRMPWPLVMGELSSSGALRMCGP